MNNSTYNPSEQLKGNQLVAFNQHGNIIVSAAAGSGKTRTMIAKIMKYLMNGFSLKDLLIIVYNNSAADELREKLHAELNKAMLNVDEDTFVHLNRQSDELHLCHISTIHAYCQSLIKENFSALGISPTFEVLDEDKHKEYMNKAIENVIAAYSDKQDPIFEEIVSIFAQSRKEENLKSNVIKLFQIVDVQTDKDAFFKKVGDAYESFDVFNGFILEYEKNYFKNCSCRHVQAGE